MGTYGCCDNFSTGTTAGCTCGEVLCFQQKQAGRSFFTGEKCSGWEYSKGTFSRFQSYDGLGTSGNNTATVTVRSTRSVDGICRPLVKVFLYNGCEDYFPVTKSYATMRRVYRVGISSHPADPNTASLRNGYVVSSHDHRDRYCP
ncbi:MAG: hypothetical protein MJE77_19310 [Proteobacteria bacterium]|nr:hypothetical protein [Pseudomonadota bacterium]